MFQNSPKLDDEGYSIRPDDDGEEEDILGNLLKHFPQIVPLLISRLLLVCSQGLSNSHSYEILMKLQSNKGQTFTTRQSECRVLKVQAEE